jgi:hypothetical protein
VAFDDQTQGTIRYRTRITACPDLTSQSSVRYALQGTAISYCLGNALISFKSRTLRMTSQIFHGLGFYWARHCGLFDLPESHPLPSPDDTPDVAQRVWRTWVAHECRLRTLLGMYTLDGIISQYSGNPTFAQHMSNSLPMPSDESVFRASNSSEWIQCSMQVRPSTGSQTFSDVFRVFFYSEGDPRDTLLPDLTFVAIKVVLEGFKSLVADSKRLDPRPVGVPSPAEINRALHRLRQYIENLPGLTHLERLTTILRWHAVCLDTWKVAARGARRLCFSYGIPQHIFGGCERFETDIDPQRHVDQDDARRTLLHAREIQRITAQLPLGLAHDPHVPGAIFAAATTYAAFALAGRKRIAFPDSPDWHVAVLCPDLPAESNRQGRLTASFVRGTLEPNDAAKIVDISYELSAIKLLIRGLSLQWGVCAEMEEVVDAWIVRCT